MLKLIVLVAFTASFAQAQQCPDNDADYKGGDLKLNLDVPSWKACGDSCQKEAGCTGFTYVQKTKCCYLKSGDARSTRVAAPGLISGDKNCGESITVNSDPKYPVKQVPGGFCYFQTQELLKKDTLIGTIPTFGKSYEVSFDLYPRSFPTGWFTYTNVLHFTKGGDMWAIGDRIPALWFYNSNMLHFCSSLSGTINKCVNLADQPVNQWYNIKIQQKLEGGDYVYKIFINGDNVQQWTNTQPQEFKNVKLYTADPWYEPADAYMKNLCFSTL